MRIIVTWMVYFLIFVVLLLGRTTWDSYRFYHLGLQHEQENLGASIRYYGSSLQSRPLLTIYSDRSYEALLRIRDALTDKRMILLIDDELQSYRTHSKKPE